jgi:ATP-dependent protease ClpP protease subunit
MQIKKAIDEDFEYYQHPRVLVQPTKRKPYSQYEYKYNVVETHFYISEEIEDPNMYTDMIHCFNMAGPTDIIYVHLNTTGGRLDTGVQIINAMNNSQAKVVTILECLAYSLGTLIFLSGHELIVNDNCVMMLHNFRGGVFGKGNELTSQLEATIKWFSVLANDIYIPFVTEDELARIVKGEDLWMQSSEIRKRLTNVTQSVLTSIDTPIPTQNPKRITTK